MMLKRADQLKAGDKVLMKDGTTDWLRARATAAGVSHTILCSALDMPCSALYSNRMTINENPWYMDGIFGQRLDEVTDAERKRGKAEVDVEYWASVRDETIRQLFADKVPVKAIVAASGLSRERVYQIRDNRR